MLLGAIALAALASLTGCGSKRASAAVPVDPVHACRGYEYYDALKEPPANNERAVLQYATDTLAILDKIDPTKQVRDPRNEKRRVPNRVVTDLGVLRTSMTRFRVAVKAVDGDAAALRRALADLSADTAYLDADARLAAYRSSSCLR